MIRARRARLSAAGILGALSMQGVLAQTSAPACSDIQNTWTAPFGKYVLSQSAGGSITGTVTANGSTCQSGTTMSVTGQAGSSGSIFINVPNGIQPNGNTCIGDHGSITISGPGCTQATYSFVLANLGGSGTAAFTAQQCLVPTGETTPAFVTWDPSQPSVAIFSQTPTSSTYYDWGGRELSEVFPSRGIDTCYFEGSDIPDASDGPAFRPILHFERNAGYQDKVGPTPDTVTYYRKHGKTPCGITLYQDVLTDCPAHDTAFAHNTLIEDIGDTTVTSKRGNSAPVSETWGPPPSRDLIGILISFILEPVIH